MDCEHSDFEKLDAAIAPARWWRRPPERTSKISKAACIMAAGFALVVLLGTAPVTALAQEPALPQEMQQAADKSAPDSSDAAVQQSSTQTVPPRRNLLISMDVVRRSPRAMPPSRLQQLTSPKSLTVGMKRPKTAAEAKIPMRARRSSGMRPSRP